MRVALLSFWHVHATAEALAHPEVELAAVWDDDELRGRREAEARSVPFIRDLQAILDDASIDSVILTAATAEHSNLLTAAINAGKHIFSEKVLTTSTEEAVRVVHAAKEAGVKLVVSLPRLYDGYTHTIKKVLEQGTLGRLTLARIRISHEGSLASKDHPDGWLPSHFYDAEAAGGGALTDFGVHPLYLVRHFMGMPHKVSSFYGHVTDRQVEDNAVAILNYDNGALGVVETGFVNPHRWFSVELHGTEGLLTYGGLESRLRVSRGAAHAPVWEEMDLLAPTLTPFALWVEHALRETVQTRSAVAENQKAAVDITRLVEAVQQSAQTGQSIRPR